MTSEDVTEQVDIALSDDTKDARLVGPPAEFLIGNETGPVHPLDGLEARDTKS